jgi:hypothetical protein
MDEFSTTSFTLDQTDEDILIYTVSDEVLEAAAGMEEPYPSAPWVRTEAPATVCGC